MSNEILIVDDSIDDLHMLESILVEAGYHIRVARNGESGIRTAQYAPPDVILVDLMLPDQSGFTVCKRLKELASLQRTPLIVVSGIDDVELKGRAFEIGASDFITKPFNKEEILVRVHHQVERTFLAQQIEEITRKQERDHIVRELHDALKDSLFVIGVLSQSMLLKSDELSASAIERLTHINQLAMAASAEVRTLLMELWPSYVHTTSMKQLLEQLVAASRMRLGKDIRLIVDITEDLQPSKKLMCYRIAQEALANIIRHAEPSWVQVELSVGGGNCRLTIEDDGKGFDTDARFGGIGIQSMKERAQQEGATITITSAPDAGTRIDVVFAMAGLRANF